MNSRFKKIISISFIISLFFASGFFLSDTFTVMGTANYPQMGLNGNSVSDIYPDKTDSQSTNQQTFDFQNTDFESPVVSTGTPAVNEGTPGLYWQTTDSDGVVEFWRDTDVPAHGGEQFVELNAANQASIYQDIHGDFTPGQEISYTFYHAARTDQPGDKKPESLKFVAGAPGEDTNSNELESVVAPGSYVSPEYSVTPQEGWVEHSGTFVVPDNVTDTLRVGFVATSIPDGWNVNLSTGNFLDDVYFGTSTAPIYGNTVEIVPNSKYTSVDGVSNKTSTTVKIDINKVEDLSDINPINQSVEVILPAGATIPTSATVYYDGDTSNTSNLTITSTGTNTFTLTGFKDITYDTMSISFDTTFTDASTNPEVLANYKYSSEEVLGTVLPHNVWGIDRATMQKEYVLSFDLNGATAGTKPADQYLRESDPTVDPNSTDITKPGYTFTGWNTQADGKGQHWDFNTMKMPPADTVLYAEWQSTSHVVKFDVNGGDISTQPQDQQVNTGNYITKPADPSYTGYTFTGWNTQPDGNGTAWDFTTMPMPNNDLTLYAQWDINYYTVSFDNNGGEGQNPQSQTHSVGEKVTDPGNPTRTGYTFTGWNTQADGSGATWNFNTNTMPANDVKLYAQWSTSAYEVTFDLNGGDSTQPSKQTVPFGAKVTDPGNPTRTGYTFTSWNTQKDGSGETWNFNTSTMPANNITLYAQWTPVEYTAKFDLNGVPGTAPADQKHYYGDSIAKPADPISTGYTFISWNTASDGSGQTWNFNTDKMPAQDITLYAQWSTSKYQVTFDLNGGDSAQPSAQDVDYGDLVTNPGDPTRTGYTFAGWNTQKNGSGDTWDFDNDTVGASNMTLYAQWTPVKYNVVFDVNNGDSAPPASQTHTVEEYITKPADPTRSGYTFTGWSTSIDGSAGTWNFSTTKMPAQDITLYAQWSTSEYVVDFNLNGGEGVTPNSQAVNFGDKVVEPATPVRTGYKFVGWNTQANGQGKTWNFATDTMGASNMTLYAQWEKVNYTVTFDVNGGDSATPNQQSVGYNELVSNPGNPSKVGYEFLGWNTQKDGKGDTWDFNNDKMPANDITLYAQWGVDVNSVTFDLNGAPGIAPAKQNVAFGNYIDEPTQPTWEGHEFISWNTEKDGSGKDWNFTSDTMTATDLTLYAQWDLGQYTMSFDKQGGTGTANSQTLSYGSYATKPADPTKTGYTFAGWYTEPNGQGKMWNFATDTMPGNDITLYAYWTSDVNTVTFDLNGGDSAYIDSQQVPFDQLITKPADPSRTGYTFVEWNTQANGNGTTWDFNTMKMPDSNLTLYAQWSVDSYKVHYDLNTGDGQAPLDQTVNYGAKVSKPANPTKAGYTFIGWSTDIGGTNLWDFNVDTMPANDITLYAQWEVGSNKVTFDLNGGDSADIPQQTVEYGALITKPQDPTRTGYTFTGWNTAQNGTGTNWDFATMPMPDKSITLYAQWTKNTYTASFDVNTGTSQNPNSQEVLYGDKIQQPAAPTKTGYTFLGWNTQANGQGTDWNFNTNTMPASDITLYAQWGVGNNTVYFNLNGGDSAPIAPINVEYNALIPKPTDPTRTGYTFTGWNTSQDGTGTTWDFATMKMPDTSMTLYAQWEVNSYTLSYNLNGGDSAAIADVEVDYGQKTTKPQDPTRSGYNFVGWNTQADGKGQMVNFATNTMPANDVTLYAQWQIGMYSVTYDLNGAPGTPPGVEFYSFGDKLVEPTPPTRPGYEFLGWNLSPQGFGPMWDYDNNVMLASNITLYAQWSVNTNVVHFDVNGGDTQNPSDQNVDFGDLITQPADPTRAGYTFKGWSTTQNGSSGIWNFSTNTMPDAETTLYAQWEINQYTATYNVNGGESAPPSQQKLNYNDKLTKPSDPTRTGYTFVGWNTSADGSGTTWDFATDTMPANDITLYAQWQINSYQVSFDLNGAQGTAPDKQTVMYDELITKPADPSRTGYEFLGWSTTKDGSSGIWNYSYDKMPAKDIVLYAQWSTNEYVVSYELNGGESAKPSDQIVEFGSSVPQPTNPSRTGYAFTGWSTSADGSTGLWDFSTDKMPDNNLVLYAQWDVQNYKVSFNLNGGNSAAIADQNLDYGQYVQKPADPSRTGYDFVSWNTAADGSGSTWDFNVDTMPDKNLVLYAQWDVNQYTVSYDLNGGTGTTPASETLDFGAQLTKPTTPVRAGYTFLGWNTKADGSGTMWNYPTDGMLAEDFTLYAQWSAQPYYVSYDLNGAPGTPPAKEQVRVDELVTEPKAPTRTGYTFLGWSTNPEGQGTTWDFNTMVMPPNDMTLYAQWGVDAHQVTFDTNGADSVTPSSQTVEYNDFITEPVVPVKEGYKFMGWNTMKDGSGKTWTFNVDRMPENDMTLYAQWEEIDYTVSYNVNGGQSQAPSSETLNFGDLVTEPTVPTRSGYEFLGWTTVLNDESTAWDFANDTMPSKDIILYANWERQDYTVTFDLNGATGVVPPVQTHYYGEEIQRPNNPTREFYEFVEWNTSADGTGTKWDFVNMMMPDEDITLYAIWDIQAPIVDPAIPGDTCVTGEGDPGSVITIHDQNGNVLGTAVVRPDGTWEVCGLDPNAPGNIDVDQTDPNGNTSESVPLHTVNYDTNGADTATPEGQFVKEGALVTKPTNPERAYYEFLGWNLDNTQDGAYWDFGKDTMGTENIVLYAQWNILPPTVDPISPGDTCITGEAAPGNMIQITDENGNVIGTAVVNPDGTWQVCDLNPGDTGNIDIVQTDPDGNTSDKVPFYTVVYDTNGADTQTPPNQYIESGVLVSEPAVPTKSYSEFLGWNTSDDGTGTTWVFETMKMPEADVNLYAQWNLLPPTVDPIAPGDTCISGEAGAGNIVEITDENGDVIGTAVVRPDGSWEVCGLDPEDTGNIGVDQTTPDGETSDKVEFYAVVYDSNGADSTPPNQYLPAGDLLANPGVPTKDYNEFLGWNTADDGTGTNWIFERMTMPADDVYLYAQWELLPPTVDPTQPGDTCVTGEAAPGNIVEITDSEGNVIGTAVVRPDGSWEVCDLDPEDTGNIGVDQTDPDGNTSEKVDLYAVVYDSNGAESTPPNQYLTAGEQIVNPGVPTKAYNEFLGWNTSDDGNGINWVFEKMTMPADNVYLYAQWELLPPTVDPTKPGDTCVTGEGAPGNTIEITDSEGNVVGTAVVRPDGTWEVCDLNPDETGNIDVIQTDPDGNTSDKVELYAVVYDSNGASTTPANQYLPAGELLVNPGVPTKDYNEFLGWNTSDDGNGTDWVFERMTMPESDVYLYAQWELLPPTVDPTQPGDTCITGEGAPGNTVEILDSEGNVVGTGVVKPDGTFEVCGLDPDNTGDIDIIQTDPDGNNSGSVHLYAVNYDTNGADTETPESQYVAEGEYIAKPADPSKDFYNFVGWSTTNDIASASWNFSKDQMPGENITLYAKWEIQAPIVDPVKPGDTCITGEGTPGATIVVTDDYGNVIREGIVDENGHYSLCGDPIDNIDNINVVQTDKDGQVSPNVSQHIDYPAKPNSSNNAEKPSGKPSSGSLAHTGENIMEMLVVGIIIILVALFVIINVIRRRK